MPPLAFKFGVLENGHCRYPVRMPEIETERLLLRRATMDDLAAFHAILSDPQATAFWSTPPHSDVEQSREWLQSMVDIPPGEGEDFVVEYQGSAIGKAGFFRFPEIGFILHPRAWGCGFAEEALRPVLERAFQVHRLEAVEADVDPKNAIAAAARQARLHRNRPSGTHLADRRPVVRQCRLALAAQLKVRTLPDGPSPRPS